MAQVSMNIEDHRAAPPALVIGAVRLGRRGPRGGERRRRARGLVPREALAGRARPRCGSRACGRARSSSSGPPACAGSARPPPPRRGEAQEAQERRAAAHNPKRAALEASGQAPKAAAPKLKPGEPAPPSMRGVLIRAGIVSAIFLPLPDLHRRLEPGRRPGRDHHRLRPHDPPRHLPRPLPLQAQMRKWEEKRAGQSAVSERARRAAARADARRATGRARVRERVVDAARDAFARYGYGEIVTPTFEETEVFVRGVGTSTDVVRKEMYTFEDRGGRSLAAPGGHGAGGPGLRPARHVQAAAAGEAWYLAPMFRYEAPQSGRYREHWQLGAEAIGSADPLLDAEVIALLDGILREVGVRAWSCGSAAWGTPRAGAPTATCSSIPGAPPRRPRREALARMRDNPLRFDSRTRRWRRSCEAPRRCSTAVAGRPGTARPCSAPSTAWGSPTRRTRRWCAGSTTTR